MITAIERFIDLVINNKPSERAANFFEEITRQVNRSTVLKGSGSPEGVTDGVLDQMYRDTAGTTGSILYIKTTDSGNAGWVLI